MTLGGSIFLLALGAILRFATNFSIAGLDIQVIGTILMIVGALGLVLSLYLWSTASRRRVTAAGSSEVVSERGERTVVE